MCKVKKEEKKVSNAFPLPPGQLWQCNSRADGEIPSPWRPNKRRHVLPPAAAGSTQHGWNQNHDQYWKLQLSHFHSRAAPSVSSDYFFQVVFTDSGSGGKAAGEAFREQQDMHVFSLTEENTIGHTSRPPVFFFPFLNAAPRNIFRPFASAAAASAYVTGEHLQRCRDRFPSVSVLKRSGGSQP